METKIPTTLEEAVSILIESLAEELPNIKELSLEEFIGKAHHSLGQAIRNEWCLWWFPNHTYAPKWPEEIPPLNKYFHDLKITHGDDISGMILTAFHNKITNTPFDQEKEIKKYHTHWIEQGYSDGIPKQ